MCDSLIESCDEILTMTILRRFSEFKARKKRKNLKSSAHGAMLT